MNTFQHQGRGTHRVPAIILAIGLAGAALLAQAAPGAHGPDGEHLDDKADGKPSGLARLADGSVNVPKLAQRRMSIRTLIAVSTEEALTVELPGRVVMDPNAGGRVQAATGGRIEAGPNGLPAAGQAVQKGEVLAYVRFLGDPFAQAQQAGQRAELKSARTLAEERLTRMEKLEGTVARKDLLAAKAELASLREREAHFEASLVAREALVAPVSGRIARADAVIGQVVDAREVLFEVVDPARLLIEASTHDTAMGNDLAAATLQSVEGVKLRFVGAAKSLRDGTLPLTFRAEGGAGKPLPLAIGQPVTVIAQSRQRIKGIVLPAAAVARNTSNEPVVWIKSGAERFIPQPVRVSPLDASRVVVTHGLSAENRVVVAGAALIAQIR